VTVASKAQLRALSWAVRQAEYWRAGFEHETAKDLYNKKLERAKAALRELTLASGEKGKKDV
jgi:hypothetical protein